MELLCDDLPYNTTRISADVIKERVLKCFKVIKEENNIVYLEFKWKAYKDITESDIEAVKLTEFALFTALKDTDGFVVSYFT